MRIKTISRRTVDCDVGVAIVANLQANGPYRQVRVKAPKKPARRPEEHALAGGNLTLVAVDAHPAQVCVEEGAELLQ